MGIIYRHQKNEPLTIAEMDGNFETLENRIKILESGPLLAEGVAKIIQEGDRVTFQGTLGTLLGQIHLPKAFPCYRGKWQPNTSYQVLDCVQIKNSLYSCLSPHTSQEFQNHGSAWALMFTIEEESNAFQ